LQKIAGKTFLKVEEKFIPQTQTMQGVSLSERE
jgi:hypothetical protein